MKVALDEHQSIQVELQEEEQRPARVRYYLRDRSQRDRVETFEISAEDARTIAMISLCEWQKLDEVFVRRRK